jgi:hypothetical protein avisC_09580
MKFLHLGRDLVKSDIPRSASGLAVINADRFDAAAAIGGWRGVLESAVPTLVFVIVLAVAPTALVAALVTSLAVSAAALLIRLVQHQSLTQVMGGVLVAVASAVWAWRSGQASDFYATGLVINAVWLAVCLGSLLVRWPVVGVLMGLWRSAAAAGSETRSSDWRAWRTGPDLAGVRRRYDVGTAVLTAMFALRLIVEVPLYLMGDAGVGFLGVVRIGLGLPLFALCLWFVWLIVRPGARAGRAAQALEPGR